MSTITWPSGLYPRSFSLRLSTVQRVHASPLGGSEQVVDLLNDRWLLSMELPANRHSTMAALEAFLAAMRGQTNTVVLYNFARPAPRGTLASATAASAAKGAAAVVLTGSGTLKAGDLLGISGLLLQVASDVTVGSSTTVPLVNRLRTAVSGAVTLAAPTATFRLVGAPSVQYLGGAFTDAVPLEFVEAIA